jgi:para-aminobenzoate synthetase
VKAVIIDNYDSFTFNLSDLIAMVEGHPPLVVENDRIHWDELAALDCDYVVLSPGPGRPENERDFGICRRVIQELNVPVLGVCLGHQGLGHYYGGKVQHAPLPVHGQLSRIYHADSHLMKGLPQGFEAVRYHSLVVARPLPDCLEEMAWTQDGILMGLRHREKPAWGVQFHPESISTEYGRKMIENFREMAQEYWRTKGQGGRRVSMAALNPRDETPLPAVETPVAWKVHSRKLEGLPDAEKAFSAFFKDEEYAFWLDSSRAEPELSRFSFMGACRGENSYVAEYDVSSRRLVARRSSGERVTCDVVIFDFLKQQLSSRSCDALDLPFDLNCGLVGYFGYELKAECGARAAHQARTPDAAFIFADRLIALDHLTRSTYLLYLGRTEDEEAARAWFNQIESSLHDLDRYVLEEPLWRPAPVEFKLKQPQDEYLRRIHECLNHIRDGESYEICLTNQFHGATEEEPFEFYRRLRHINPAPYSAFLRFGELAVACSSPERFLKIDRDFQVETKPIKGTLPRGGSAEEDHWLRELLARDVKSRAENLMIVDLLRNDLSRTCRAGSVHVPKLMHVESYATVHQLVSTIRGTLRHGMTAVDCLQNAFPGGSMTGAPKLRTLEIIDELEPEARGIYSGAIGFLGLNGTADLNIVIRTAVFQRGKVSIGVGGAIVALSDPEAEFQETMVKARALLKAFGVDVHAFSAPSHAGVH